MVAGCRSALIPVISIIPIVSFINPVIHTQNSCVSMDAPAFFTDPYKNPYLVKKTENVLATMKIKGTGKRSDPTESSFVLPGGLSILEATIKAKENHNHKSYRIYPHNKVVRMITYA